MKDKQLIKIIQMPDKMAKERGYTVDWSSRESVSASISNMDIMTQILIKCVFDLASSSFRYATKSELKSAGLWPVADEVAILKALSGEQ